MAIGRHNITLYADELERTIGAVKMHMHTPALSRGEYLYWLGVHNALEQLMKPDIPANHTTFIMQLKIHIEEGE